MVMEKLPQDGTYGIPPGFVNAQYRFIMNPSGDYTVHFADPDIFFQWHDILQVIIPRTEGTGHTTCPICLSPPTAPRMTKCGHVFCYPCILHYLHTSENKWARCPICFDSVNERQLKNVKWFDGPQSSSSPSSSSTSQSPSVSSPAPGTLLPMRLIQRPAGTTLALPRSSTYPSTLFPTSIPSTSASTGIIAPPFYFLPDVYTFARFMLATPSQFISDLSDELADLEVEKRVLAGMRDEAGIAFVDGAVRRILGMIGRVKGEQIGVSLSGEAGNWDLVQERIERVKKELAIVEDRAEKEKEWADRIKRAEEEKERERVDEVDPKGAEQGEQEVPEEFLAIKSGGAFTNGSLTLSNAPSPSKSTRNSDSIPRHPSNPHSSSAAPQTYYYYQAASGLPIYLHPLDIKILLTQFGNPVSHPGHPSQDSPDSRSSEQSKPNGSKRNPKPKPNTGRGRSHHNNYYSSSSGGGPAATGDYSALPDTILVKVDAFSEGTIDEDLRKRCKYLAHLPEGADVCFVEVDWELQSSSTSRSIPESESESLTTILPATLQPFSHALSTRRSRRREKGRKDERARVKAEEKEWEREWERTRLNGLGVARGTSLPNGHLQSRVEEFADGMGEVNVEVEQSQSEPQSHSTPVSAQSPPASGVWGSRSFASAAQSPASATPSRRAQTRQTEREREDEWEMDIAWHELEQNLHNGRGGSVKTGGKKGKGGGGRNKNTMVVLGGGGPGGGRRR
ncbi:hypothetical protein D9758_000560 [Tetrapyrgos nigripes]|uniref:RING-type domain-containing protein n=1 Tax=Tetrapyrgos nigripes TaxID=182062 RepID=A0A8H5H1D8_9AGAR|nr:hypothetical protein D9758_000560 [Tetrapyrgos nigripes]